MILKLIGKCFLLLLIVYSIVELTIFFSPFKEKDLETDFAAAIIDKQAILKATPSPKIVLIGGSSVAYGVDSKLMQDSLGVSVINMSYQYFLGSDFLFKQLLGSLNAGDKVIASFEYIVTKGGDKKEQLKAARYYPEALDWITYDSPIQYISALLRSEIEIFRGILVRIFFGSTFEPLVEDQTNVFFRKAIDENGDLISHLNNKTTAFSNCETAIDTSYFPVIANISQYSKLLKQDGIDVYFSYPSYEQNSFKNDSIVIGTINAAFKNYSEINILDSPVESVYPNQYFQDMCYHLNADGRKRRTMKLIRDFKNSQVENAL